MKETPALVERLTSSRWALAFAFILGVCLSLGCSAKRSQFDYLLNQGLVPVSADNPYMGANLFLGKEMEQNVYLYNFIRDRGSPQAIELTGDDVESAQAHFFYAPSKEEYIAKPAPKQGGANITRREWIIIGPFSVDRERYRQLEDYGNTGGAFEVFGRKEFFGNQPRAGRNETMLPVFIPTAKPTKAPTRHRRPAAATPEKPSATPAGTPVAPTNFDQQALLEKQAEAKNLADRNSDGNVVHTVTAPNETVQSISQWYTKGDNAKAIAETNGLAADAKLKVGSKVIVPKALVVNPQKMK